MEKRRERERERREEREGNPCRRGENVTKRAAWRGAARRGATWRSGGVARGTAREKSEGSANGRRATAIWQRLLWLSLRSVGKRRGAARRGATWRTRPSRADTVAASGMRIPKTRPGRPSAKRPSRKISEAANTCSARYLSSRILDRVTFSMRYCRCNAALQAAQ